MNKAIEEEARDWERYRLLMDCAHINRNTLDAYAKAWFRKYTSEYVGLEDKYPGFQMRYWALCLENAMLAAGDRDDGNFIARPNLPDWKRKAAGDE